MIERVLQRGIAERLTDLLIERQGDEEGYRNGEGQRTEELNIRWRTGRKRGRGK